MISYLQIDGLTKSFGDLVLFEDITFGIATGAGKWALLQRTVQVKQLY